jgi:hypothetical protein
MCGLGPNRAKGNPTSGSPDHAVAGPRRRALLEDVVLAISGEVDVAMGDVLGRCDAPLPMEWASGAQFLAWLLSHLVRLFSLSLVGFLLLLPYLRFVGEGALVRVTLKSFSFYGGILVGT